MWNVQCLKINLRQPINWLFLLNDAVGCWLWEPFLSATSLPVGRRALNILLHWFVVCIFLFNLLEHDVYMHTYVCSKPTHQIHCWLQYNQWNFYRVVKLSTLFSSIAYVHLNMNFEKDCLTRKFHSPKTRAAFVTQTTHNAWVVNRPYWRTVWSHLKLLIPVVWY